MTPRRGAFTSDVVGIITGQGDRIDKLERFRSDPGSPALVAAYSPIVSIPGNGTPKRVGKITLPDGLSKIDALALFSSPTGGIIGSLGIVFGGEWEEEHFLIASITTLDGSGSSGNRMTGLGLCRSAGRTTAPFYLQCSTSDGLPVNATAVLFTEPVGSVSLD